MVNKGVTPWLVDYPTCQLRQLTERGEELLAESLLCKAERASRSIKSVSHIDLLAFRYHDFNCGENQKQPDHFPDQAVRRVMAHG